MYSLEHKALGQNASGQTPCIAQQDITNNFKPREVFLDCETPYHSTLGWPVH